MEASGVQPNAANLQVETVRTSRQENTRLSQNNPFRAETIGHKSVFHFSITLFQHSFHDPPSGPSFLPSRSDAGAIVERDKGHVENVHPAIVVEVRCDIPCRARGGQSGRPEREGYRCNVHYANRLILV